MNAFYSSTIRALEDAKPFALGIISRVKGSSPQKAGAKALFLEDGTIIGTLGGGCLEAEIHRRALKALQTGAPETFELTLDHDFGWDDGLICGGTVSGIILPRAAEAGALWRALERVEEPRTWGVNQDFQVGWAGTGADASAWRYRETVYPPMPLWIAGSGHIARAVAPLALSLEFDVTLFDDRPDLVSHDHFPASVRLRTGNWGELLRTPLPARPTMGLIVTRGHQHDGLVLAEWVRQPFLHLGMIGSRRKARIIRENFISRGLATADQMDRVACPVGLDIRAQSVQEIAVSILAEYIQKRREHLAGSSEAGA